MDVSRYLGGNFLTQLDLPQPYVIWTINKVNRQMVGQGPSADQKICVMFAEHQKPLALNKTNLRRIADLYGKEDSTGWLNRQLLVFRSTTTFGNEPKLCVRVCGPTQAPPDPICDSQGNAVALQAMVQPAVAPPAQQPPAAPVPAPPPQAAPVQPGGVPAQQPSCSTLGKRREQPA